MKISKIVSVFWMVVVVTGQSANAEYKEAGRNLEDLRPDEYEKMLLSIEGLTINYVPIGSTTQADFSEMAPSILSSCKEITDYHINKQNDTWKKIGKIAENPPNNDHQLVRQQFRASKLLAQLANEYNSANFAISKCANQFNANAEFLFVLKSGSLAQQFTDQPGRASAELFSRWAATELKKLATKNRNSVRMLTEDKSDSPVGTDFSSSPNLNGRRTTVVVKSHPGLFSVVGNTLYGPEGSYSTVGNITYGPRGMYATVGNITYQPDGSSCSYVNGVAFCN